MLTPDELTNVIDFYPVLADLPPAVKQAFVISSASFHADAEAFLFDLRSPVQSFVLLTSGTVRATRPGKSGEILLYLVQPGEYCNLTICNILGQNLYQARLVAETEVSGVTLPAVLFKQMIEQSPVFCKVVLCSFSSRVSVLLDLINSITFLQLDERLAGLLAAKGSLVKATHYQLADELGSAREVISRILEDFETRGIVKLERGQVRILDPEALKKIARIV